MTTQNRPGARLRRRAVLSAGAVAALACGAASATAATATAARCPTAAQVGQIEHQKHVVYNRHVGKDGRGLLTQCLYVFLANDADVQIYASSPANQKSLRNVGPVIPAHATALKHNILFLVTAPPANPSNVNDTGESEAKAILAVALRDN